MLKFRLTSVLVVLPTFLIIFHSSFAQTAADFKVLSAVGDAISKGDFETALSYFAEDAVVKENPPFTVKNVTTFSGKQQIRQWVQKKSESHSTGTVVGTPSIEGNKLTGIEQEKSDYLQKAGIDFVLKTSEFVVVDGKIKSITQTVMPESIVKLTQAGLVSGDNNLTQGEKTVPSAAPAAGSGSTVKVEDRLPLLEVLVFIACLNAIGLCWLRRRNR